MTQRELFDGPRPFGQWNGLATSGELVWDWMRESDGDAHGPQHFATRVGEWLADRGITELPRGVLDVLGWCESGAEVVTALHFPAPGRTLRRSPDHARALVAGEDLLELQVEIPGSPYRADFRWTSRHGVALVEVYGSAVHHDRLAQDRARHRHLVNLGHVVHYVPAELVVREPEGAWPALRRRQMEAYRRRRYGRPTWNAAADAALVEPTLAGVTP